MRSLEVTARREHVELLADERFLSHGAREAAERWITQRLDWGGWLDRLLLATGSTLIVAGIVYFFAYNWASIPAFAKFALLEGMLAGGLLVTWRVGLHRTSGQVMLSACSVLVGVLLAVYGQVYQTGADAWQLFGGWAALILGWVLIGGFAPLWMLWIGLVNLTVYQHQLTHQAWAWLPFRGDTWTLLGMVNAGFLALAELGRAHDVEWLKGSWHRLTLCAAALCCLTVPAFRMAGCWERDLDVLGAGVWAMALLIGFVHYRRRAIDLTALAFGAASVGLVAFTFVAHTFLRGAFFSAGGWMISGMAAVFIAGVLGAWLHTVAGELTEGEHV